MNILEATLRVITHVINHTYVPYHHFRTHLPTSFTITRGLYRGKDYKYSVVPSYTTKDWFYMEVRPTDIYISIEPIFINERSKTRSGRVKLSSRSIPTYLKDSPFTHILPTLARPLYNYLSAIIPTTKCQVTRTLYKLP